MKILIVALGAVLVRGIASAAPPGWDDSLPHVFPLVTAKDKECCLAAKNEQRCQATRNYYRAVIISKGKDFPEQPINYDAAYLTEAQLDYVEAKLDLASLAVAGAKPPEGAKAPKKPAESCATTPKQARAAANLYLVGKEDRACCASAAKEESCLATRQYMHLVFLREHARLPPQPENFNEDYLSLTQRDFINAHLERLAAGWSEERTAASRNALDRLAFVNLRECGGRAGAGDATELAKKYPSVLQEDVESCKIVFNTKTCLATRNYFRRRMAADRQAEWENEFNKLYLSEAQNEELKSRDEQDRNAPCEGDECEY